MFNLITFIIIIIIVVNKVLGGKNSTHKPNDNTFWGEFEKTFREAKKGIDEYMHGPVKNPKEPMFEGVENIPDTPDIEGIGLEHNDDVQNKDINAEQSLMEHNLDMESKNNDNLINKVMEYEKEEFELDDLYDLNLSKEDMIKAVIFSELLNKPLCKRDAN